MVTAEKWYEYQTNYKRYGLDMKPVAPKAARAPESAAVTLAERAKMILLLLLIGVLCICLIVSTAYTAGVKYEVNSVAKGNASLTGEIENLNVKIKNATNIRAVEEKAINELGMVYPSSGQFVFLTRQTKPEGDFAMLLMEHAYN